MSKISFSYTEIHNIVKIKSIDIINQFNPDVIIAISGGGLIPARMLRTYIDIPIYTVSMRYYNKNNEIMEHPELLQWIDNDFSNKNVLIVDEIDDSGSTINFCVDKLRDINKCKNIGVFVIHYKLKTKRFDNTRLDIDYFIGQDVQDKWIQYPWDMV